MNFDDYQSVAQVTKVYSHEAKIISPALGLVSAVGEVAGKDKKLNR